jgi:hypothetical protein
MKEHRIGEIHVTADGTKLYFHSDRTGDKAGLDIWTLQKVNSEWQTPELILSQFVGEPSMDNAGNIYFTHNFYNNQSQMIEADSYVALKK